MASDELPGITTHTMVVLIEILDECREQVSERGYDAAHDDGPDYAYGELAELACYLAWPDDDLDGNGEIPVEVLLPANRTTSEHRYRQHDVRTRLKKAAALLVKEMERLDRKEEAGDA